MNYPQIIPNFKELITVAQSLDNLPRVNSKQLLDLQGNLKDLSAHDYTLLRASLITETFFLPVFIWFNPNDNQPYTLDGNQRLRVLNREIPSGIDLPYVEVKAADKNDAKRKILITSSQFGKTTKEGFDEFSASFQDAAVDFDAFVKGYTTFDDFLDAIAEIQEEGEMPASENPDVPFSTFLEEKSNYLVLKFDTEQDWLYACTVLSDFIHRVHSARSNGKPWSIGTGRILDGVAVIKHLQTTEP